MICPNKSFNIAILVQNGNVNENAVRYHQIDLHTDEGKSGDAVTTFDELPQSYFVSSCQDDSARQKHNQNMLTPTCSKSLSSSFTATYDATTFLSDSFPQFQSRKKRKGSPEMSSGLPVISTGQAALILSRDNSSESTFRSPQYHAVTFSLPQSGNTSLAQTANFRKDHELLMIRQPGLQRSGPMSLSKDLWSFEKFDIVELCTGMCLFSEQDLDFCIREGTIQPARLAQLPISLCEKEIITRLSTTIANTAGLYFHGREERREQTLRINIDIPSVQYYKDALNSYSDGKCISKDVLEWIAAIKDRRHLLFSAFSKAIEYRLHERCVPKGKVDIVLSCGLKAADEGIFCALHLSSAPHDWLQLILTSVLGDSTEFWADFMELLGDNERYPSSWRQLSTLSYMYEVAKPVLRARSAKILQPKIDEYFSTSQTCCEANTTTIDSVSRCSKADSCSKIDVFDVGRKSSSDSTTRVLLLAIDDIDECRIYTKAYQSLCRLSTASARSPGANTMSFGPVTTRILTICPAPRIIFGTLGSDPNWTRRSLWRAQLRNGETEKIALRFCTEDQLLEADSDVLKKVYDEHLVAQLENWVKK